MCILAFVFSEQPLSRLAVIDQAPEFTLVDQANKSVKLSGQKGKVLLVSFVFTTCNGSCPATTHRMASVQQELKRLGLWKSGDVQFLSITLDPDRDTSDALQRYMRLYDLDGVGWSFLTGPPSEVTKTFTSWGMWAKAAANGQLDHPSRIFLVDRQLRIREIYNTELLNAANVGEDIGLLLREDPGQLIPRRQPAPR
jgi:protein SCO1/2